MYTHAVYILAAPLPVRVFWVTFGYIRWFDDAVHTIVSFYQVLMLCWVWVRAYVFVGSGMCGSVRAQAGWQPDYGHQYTGRGAEDQPDAATPIVSEAQHHGPVCRRCFIVPYINNIFTHVGQACPSHSWLCDDIHATHLHPFTATVPLLYRHTTLPHVGNIA